MQLRGYDEYEVTLGDEMRGERASLGRTLANAEHDLRIKADIIRAIEDCDLDGFPNDSVVAGYVRSYARYLGLDPEECYRRFCAESGFRSPVSAIGDFDQPVQSGGMQNIVAAGAAFGTGLTQSRFAVRSGPARMNARISLGGLTSVLAMLALIAGIGYGGYGLLQDIQRVRVAPLTEAPDVVAEAPRISPPVIESGLLLRPDANAYRGDGVLAAVEPAELPPPSLPPRDGPISAIDPATSGVFRDFDPSLLAGPEQDGPQLAEVSPDNAGANAAPADTMPAKIVPAGPPKIIIHATDTAWIRVRDGEAGVIYEGTLTAGDRFEIPPRVAAPLLRTGNAGAVFVLVGDSTYGPVGDRGRVIKNMSLLAADVESRIPETTAAAIGIAPGDDFLQRADANVLQ